MVCSTDKKKIWQHIQLIFYLVEEERPGNGSLRPGSDRQVGEGGGEGQVQTLHELVLLEKAKGSQLRNKRVVVRTRKS